MRPPLGFGRWGPAPQAAGAGAASSGLHRLAGASSSSKQPAGAPEAADDSKIAAVAPAAEPAVCNRLSAASPGGRFGLARAGAFEDALQALVRIKGLHPSHDLRLSGDIVWCKQSGGYARQRFKSLKEKCGGPEAAKSRASQTANLREGRHPLTGEAVGKPAAKSLTRSVPTSARGTSSTSTARTSRSSAVARMGAARASPWL